MRISDWSSDVCSSDLGVTIGIDYRFKNTGLFTSYAQSHYRGVLGLRGKAGQFEWEVSGWQSRDEAGSTGPSGFDSDAILEAMYSQDPALTINPFVSDGSSPASREFLDRKSTRLNSSH